MTQDLLNQILRKWMMYSAVGAALLVGAEGLHKLAPSIHISIIGMSPEDALQHPVFIFGLVLAATLVGSVIFTFWPPPRKPR